MSYVSSQIVEEQLQRRGLGEYSHAELCRIAALALEHIALSSAEHSYNCTIVMQSDSCTRVLVVGTDSKGYTTLLNMQPA